MQNQLSHRGMNQVRSRKTHHGWSGHTRGIVKDGRTADVVPAVRWLLRRDAIIGTNISNTSQTLYTIATNVSGSGLSAEHTAVNAGVVCH